MNMTKLTLQETISNIENKKGFTISLSKEIKNDEKTKEAMAIQMMKKNFSTHVCKLLIQSAHENNATIEIKKELEQIKEAIQNLNPINSSENNKSTIEDITLQEENRELLNNNKILIEENKKLSENNLMLEKRKVQLVEDNNSLLIENTQYKSKVESLSEKIHTIVSQQNTSESIEKYIAEYNDLKEKHDSLNQVYSRLKHNHEVLLDTHNDKLKETNNLLEENRKLKLQLNGVGQYKEWVKDINEGIRTETVIDKNRHRGGGSQPNSNGSKFSLHDNPYG